MKTLLTYLLTFVTLFVWQVYADGMKTNDWGAVTNNFQMSISLKGDKSEITNNQPCILLVRYKNVSTNETLNVYEAEHDPSYSFTVISPSGKDISQDIKKFHPSDSGGYIPVRPNQSVKFEFNLSYLYDLHEVGTYKVIAKKKVWSFERHQTFTVVSSPLFVSVVSNKQ
jgi:hypothetical protein